MHALARAETGTVQRVIKAIRKRLLPRTRPDTH